MPTYSERRSIRETLSLPIPEAFFDTLVALLAEWLGTTFFLFFALAGCQVAFTPLTPAAVLSPSNPLTRDMPLVSTASLLYAALSVAFAFTVSVWVFFRVTSALFNPAIAVGMCLVGSMHWKRGIWVVGSQVLGGMTAAGLVSGLFPGRIRAETLLGGGTSVVRGFCEYAAIRCVGSPGLMLWCSH